MANFNQIDKARRLFSLGEYAAFEEIKKAYRKLAHKYHPDKCRDEKKKECEKMFKKIAHANNILMTYCAGYNYSFKEKDVKRNSVDEESCEHLGRFYDGWW